MPRVNVRGMSRTFLVFGVIAALAAACWWYGRQAPQDVKPSPGAPAHALSVVHGPARIAPAKRRELASESPAPVPSPKPPDYAAQYRHSADLLAYLEALAPAAADGDLQAMYYLAVASRRCTREYATLFGPPGKEKTLEAALETDYWTRYYEKTARRIHAQCARFKAARDNPFTEWQDLLEAAGEAGSGAAKALLTFEMQQGLIRVHDPATRAARQDEIRALAKEALRTREPEVLHHLAFVETITGRAGTPGDVAGIWMLAACQRGLACGRDTEQFQVFCRWEPACQQTETMVDLIRRREGDRFDEFQRQANELNAKLDADRFDEIIP